MPLATPGGFAIIGDLPSSGVAVIQLHLLHPEYPGYERRALVRVESGTHN